MKSHTKRRILRVSGTLLILSGMTLLGWYGASRVRTYLYQQRRLADLNRQMMQPPARRAIVAAPREGALLGSVHIPRVGVSSVIIEGSDEQDLALSVGHIPGTAIPGQDGNVALAAHRDSFFRGLEKIRQGDDILLTTPQGTQLYEVDSTRVVMPKDVYVLDDVGRPVLTLVTCYPFHFIGDAPQRFIVQARLRGGPIASAAATARHDTGARE